MPSREPSTARVLSGLDGGNPLAFLAAVGTLRTVTRAAPSAGWTMSWKTHDGHWSPVLVGGTSLTEDGLIELLMPALKTMDGDPALCFADDLTIGREQFREIAQDAQRVATLADRHFADFVAAFGCDSLSVPRKDQIQDTALRTMSGAGHQHFLKSMRELVETTEPSHLKDSFLGRHSWMSRSSGRCSAWKSCNSPGRTKAASWREESSRYIGVSASPWTSTGTSPPRCRHERLEAEVPGTGADGGYLTIWRRFG